MPDHSSLAKQAGAKLGVELVRTVRFDRAALRRLTGGHDCNGDDVIRAAADYLTREVQRIDERRSQPWKEDS
jgi:hypothetical protein